MGAHLRTVHILSFATAVSLTTEPKAAATKDEDMMAWSSSPMRIIIQLRLIVLLHDTSVCDPISEGTYTLLYSLPRSTSIDIAP